VDGRVRVGWGLDGVLAGLPVVLGVGLIACGVGLVVWTVGLFVREGEGTLAPWDPTAKLVVRGPYRHVRHPMIGGVATILLGEAVLLGSTAVAGWLVAVVTVNAVYLPLVEERGLVRRFGSDYEVYRANVPRFVPRLSAWDPAR
jgi:protein-S-isoprenylcysteine O-methyltransferase Ste14